MKCGMLWKSLRSRIYTVVVAFLAMVLTLCLAGETFTIYWDQEMGLKRNRDAFLGDAETIYVMNLALGENTADVGEAIAGAYREIRQEAGLKRFGAYKMNACIFDELQDTDTEFYQKNNDIWSAWGLHGERGNLIWCLEIYGNIDDLFRLDTAEGEFDTVEENDGVFPILVSDGYRDEFSVGERLHTFGREYQVTGYLEPDGYFPYNNAFSAGNQGGQDMEYLFVIRYDFTDPVRSDGSILNFYENTYLEFADGRKEEQMAAIDKIMEKWGLLYKLQSVEESYQDAIQKTMETNGIRLKYGSIFLFVNLFVGISISVVQSLRRRREFGICQACGWTQKELNRLLLVESVIEKILALIIAGGWLIQKTAEWKSGSVMGRILDSYETVFWQRTIPFLILYLAGMTLLSYLVSVHLLKQKDCVELINQKRA